MSAETSAQSRGTLYIFLYFLSGIAALGYEVLWARMLSLQFGVSIFGIVVTVGSFMVGLGAGSLAATRRGKRISRPILVFGLLECAVGVYALVLPLLAGTFSTAVAEVSATLSLASWYGAHILFDLILMTLPSFAMGAAFPMILRGAKQFGVGVSHLYGFNALGGVVGAVLPVVMLPSIGWENTAQLFAALGLCVGITALMAEKRPASIAEAAPTSRIRIEPRTMVLYALIGAAALMLEISWTRLFGMVLLRTEYVLAIIVATFLAGIGIGSIIARYLRRSIWLALLPVFSGFCALLTLWMLPTLSRWVEGSHFGSLEAALVTQGMAIALLTLPATLAFGAWLPMLAEKSDSTGDAAAALYGANSLGAALGVFVAGFVLVPLIGTPATVVVAAILLGMSGLTLANAKSIRVIAAGLVMTATGLPVAALPSVQELFPRTHPTGKDLYLHEDAVTTTHVVQYQDGHRVLLDDLQRMDASSEPDAVELQRNQVRLPLLLHPAPQSVLLLGLGTGISASGVPASQNISVEAVELSQGAIDAAREFFSPVNDHISDRITIRRDDARRALLNPSKAYDVIVGDLFHPDLAGRSALLSVEQFRRARERLKEGGVFTQWIALNQFSPESLDVVLRTFLSVFPDGVLFIDPFRVALVGTRAGSIQFRPPGGTNDIPVASDTATSGEGIWTWAGRYLGRADDFVTLSGPVQEELHPHIEYLLPKARYSGEIDIASLLQRLLKHRPKSDRAARDLGIADASRPFFDRAYAATELALAGWIATLKDHGTDGTRLLQLAYQSNPLDRWIGVALVAPVWEKLVEISEQNKDPMPVFGKDEREVIQAILAQRPDFVPAIKRLEYLERTSGHEDAANALQVKLRSLSPLDAKRIP